MRQAALMYALGLGWVGGVSERRREQGGGGKKVEFFFLRFRFPSFARSLDNTRQAALKPS